MIEKLNNSSVKKEGVEILGERDGFKAIDGAKYIGDITEPGDAIETKIYKDVKKNKLIFHYSQDIEPMVRFNHALKKKQVADEVWEGGKCFKLAYRIPLACYQIMESFGYFEAGNEKQLKRLLKENAHLFQCTNRNV